MAWHPTGSSAIVAADLTGAAEQEVMLTLDVTSAIDGTVVDSKGEPLGDAQVIAMPREGTPEARAEWLVRGVQEAVSDPGGAFHFSGLPAGTYRIRAARAGASEASLWLSGGVDAQPGGAPVKIVVPADGGVAGKVAFADGHAPAMMSISIDGTGSTAFAEKDGSFTSDAAAGTRKIIVSGPGFVTTTVRDVKIEEGKVTDLGTIQVEAGRSISGRVLDANGAPVPGALVAAGRLLSGGGNELFIPSESIDARSVETDEDGRYVIPGFTEAPVTVVAGADGVGRSSSVVVPRGPESAVVDLVLAPVGGLDGVVTRGGKPVPDTIVIANPLGVTPSNFFVTTGPDGTFAFDALTGGPYTVYPMVGGGGSSPKDIFVTGADVVAGERAKVTIDIPDGKNQVTITCHGDDGYEVVIAAVALIQAHVNGENIESLRAGSSFPRDLYSHGVGAVYMRQMMGTPVVIDGVAPGEYSACVAPLPVGHDMQAAMAMRDKVETLPMKCDPVSVLPTPAAQTVDIVVPAAWTRPPG